MWFGFLDEEFGYFAIIRGIIDATKGVKHVLGKNSSPIMRLVDIGGICTIPRGSCMKARRIDLESPVSICYLLEEHVFREGVRNVT